MNTQRRRGSLAVAGAVGLALSAATAGAQTESTANLGEVIVTAQKRSEALTDVPMSVSVLPGEALERQQVDNFQDFAALVPGLSINTNTRGITRLTIRGINTGGVASTVGVYVDEVPFGSSSGLANGAILSGDFDTFDMARIEVLRGPQGTLYGASSLAGVIKYVTNEPSTDGFEGRAQASMEDVEGGGTGYAATGVVNIPLGETFAIRASGFYRSDEGFIDSIGNNPILFFADPSVTIVDGTRVEDDLNSLDTTGGRLSAQFEPNENFSLNLAAFFQNIDSDGADMFEADPDTLAPLYGGFVVSRYHPEYTDIDYRIYSATIDWDLGPVTLQSVTSYGEFEQTFQRDAALVPLGGLPVSQLATLIYGTPLSAILNQITFTDKFTQELRLVSPESDSFDWLAGIYYTDEDSGLDPQTYTLVDPGTENPAAGIPNLADGSLVSTYEELAVFANATWHITDRFDLAFGGRWSDNDQEASQTLTIGLPPELGGGTAVFDGLTSSESPFTWSVSPRFEFSDTTSMYARVATGFRPGGPNVLPPGVLPEFATYDSDELTSYEIGFRTGTGSGSFSLDVAAYYLDWEDIQLLIQVSGVGLNANGGTAESKGFELTATARPTDGLSLIFTTAYTDAQLTEDTDPVAVGGFDGDPLPFVPEWTMGLGGDYEWSAFGDATAYVGGQISYTGKRSTDFDNRTGPLPTDAIRETDDYTTLDLRTGILWDNWSLELYGKNVTDEEGINDVNSDIVYPNGAVGVGVIRPRAIGVAVGYRF
jgi:outer membrane receptor protein involved in Fe transport